MKTTRSAEEIIARIEAGEDEDWLGTFRSDLICNLSFDDAVLFLREGVTKEDWESATVKGPLQEAREYLEFAWGKANGCRGISASRSIDHFRAWLWLAGVDDFDEIAAREYQFYGKPVLVIVSVALEVDWKALDDGMWTNMEGGPYDVPDPAEIERLTAIGQGIKAQLTE